MLTICYVTHRRYNCIQWFLDAVDHELRATPTPLRIVVVDFYAEERQGTLPDVVLHVPPKPCVWQGKHRLTTRDYFAASNARNTGLCLAPDGWIAYVDDLSVLLPGWLQRVQAAMRDNYVVFGAYRKVCGLEVRNGEVVCYLDHPAGHDSRWAFGSDEEAVRTGAGSLFGCSLAMPVEILLSVNGWNEFHCDGMGYEDGSMGMQLSRHYQDLLDMRYDRRMMTFESEEMHYVEPPFLRIDKKMPRAITASDDASHSMSRAMMTGNGVAPNLFDIRVMRRQVLAGEPFPIPTEPAHHWPDGQPLREM